MNTIHNTIIFGVTFSFLLAPPIFAKALDRFEIGKQKAKVCMTCHGEDGISTLDPYPNLRGQKYGYLISALKDYKSRERTSGLAILMQQEAANLSEQDIKDISYYYSHLGKDEQ
ncbi:cytochrome c [Vibrio sp. S4M6]|uniref:c-type cytochrome n=1 Tax=Vibrio sinus TaxID=2946865 RepID=UPI00202A93D1|nr:cytochrome c [Vibrio sinus]MCL9781597.1 cytochrome c [Vibrio sinus]